MLNIGLGPVLFNQVIDMFGAGVFNSDGMLVGS